MLCFLPHTHICRGTIQAVREQCETYEAKKKTASSLLFILLVLGLNNAMDSQEGSGLL